MQYGYSKGIIEMERCGKLKNIIWSDEIQEKLTKRGLQLINRINEAKWFTKNETIMDCILKYVRNKELSYEYIVLMNHIRIFKRMILPYKLVK